jgi:putative iron-regulated protein
LIENDYHFQQEDPDNMMKRVALAFLLAGTAACVSNQEPGRTCQDIGDVCGEIYDGNATFGAECHELADKGAESACAPKRDACIKFCTLNDAPEVVANYTKVVFKGYDETVASATALRAAVLTFVAAPSDLNFTAAKEAWKTARIPYGQTEAFRFYDGPIDNAEAGPEGQINAWPLDEFFIDYVVGTSGPTAGLINNPSELPEVTVEAIVALNESIDEKSISTGYHAIEFLLWGQDLSDTGPGARPFTDYVDGGTAANQGRRRAYLEALVTLLVDDLSSVRDQWTESAKYRKDFEAQNVRQALSKMLTGMGSLTKGELRGERIRVGYESKEQEDEHSCFSDTTIADYASNAEAIQNVYLGKFGDLDGPGIDVLVEARDPELNARMKAQLQASIDAIRAIPQPFDQAILGADSAPGRVKIQAALDALALQADTIQEVAALLGLSKVDDSAGVKPE